MKWSETTWQQATPIYNNITAMPFIQELAAGTLHLDKFKFYMQQDAHYLEYFARTLAVIGAKINNVEAMLDFIRFAEGAVVVERALHDGYFKEYNITQRAAISPTCHHYVHFMQSMAYGANVAVAMAAVLPCFWIYREVGNYIVQIQNTNNNPYTNWIATYAGEDFNTIVNRAIDLCDAAALEATKEQQKAMTAAFLTASRLEFAFWDSAYKVEEWW
ncbi:thiaminase II [Flavobacterium sp. Sd200]|uniref:thiaminase II n=1 Tax=Flavobacterium sp. Sd200 TaxID=2692211 RepID=UPI00136D82ED|nr:thiaminase II [Flavobacterium sp. Sd200]MXN91060.1 thiaminase II [Flavobacterium sp. Sd200]